ncbi:hypothetical protein E3Q22_04450 [Wallemia mellicola]|uniref:F-box domain-containing protein n=1 Tax=Wallemia mellicola TaxID=1708541 RepID=A0A4T0LPP5_9BASI|nr:hypothetical protein E3Q22_04450 [Wallemia mellicola]TIC06139.1 hypothetical protein E3Q14_04471 [Wallemia mellicola]
MAETLIEVDSNYLVRFSQLNRRWRKTLFETSSLFEKCIVAYDLKTTFKTIRKIKWFMQFNLKHIKFVHFNDLSIFDPSDMGDRNESLELLRADYDDMRMDSVEITTEFWIKPRQFICNRIAEILEHFNVVSIAHLIINGKNFGRDLGEAPLLSFRKFGKKDIEKLTLIGPIWVDEDERDSYLFPYVKSVECWGAYTRSIHVMCPNLLHYEAKMCVAKLTPELAVCIAEHVSRIDHETLSNLTRVSSLWRNTLFREPQLFNRSTVTFKRKEEYKALRKIAWFRKLGLRHLKFINVSDLNLKTFSSYGDPQESLEILGHSDFEEASLDSVEIVLPLCPRKHICDRIYEMLEYFKITQIRHLIINVRDCYTSPGEQIELPFARFQNKCLENLTIKALLRVDSYASTDFDLCQARGLLIENNVPIVHTLVPTKQIGRNTSDKEDDSI